MARDLMDNTYQGIFSCFLSQSSTGQDVRIIIDTEYLGHVIFSNSFTYPHDTVASVVKKPFPYVRANHGNGILDGFADVL
jgi:hypothetical protein